MLVLLCAALAGAQSMAQAVAVDPGLMAKATAGDAASELAVGHAYEKGDGAKPDYTQASAWYRKAADQNNVDAQIQLAVFYRDGRGVKRDMAEAAAWYRKAAELGNASAQGTLGLLYSIGQGIPASDEEAYYWFALAAAVAGPEQARYETNRVRMAARLTADDLGDAKDRVEKWLAAHPRTSAIAK
jgi:TPR repeat protein